MVQLALAFIRATRQGNWDLHLAVVRKIPPWICAYGHIHYMRSLTLYFYEMSCLSPNVLHYMKQGYFSVQRKDDDLFSKILKNLKVMLING